MEVDSIPGFSDLLPGAFGQAYNEAAFRYFLAVDRSRAARSRRVVILVLASVRAPEGHRAKLSQDTAAALFTGLAASVREVDFVGWFYKGRVAGAVLSQGDGSAYDRAAIRNRILATLKTSLPAGRAKHVQVRVIRFGGRTER